MRPLGKNVYIEILPDEVKEQTENGLRRVGSAIDIPGNLKRGKIKAVSFDLPENYKFLKPDMVIIFNKNNTFNYVIRDKECFMNCEDILGVEE